MRSRQYCESENPLSLVFCVSDGKTTRLCLRADIRYSQVIATFFRVNGIGTLSIKRLSQKQVISSKPWVPDSLKKKIISWFFSTLIPLACFRLMNQFVAYSTKALFRFELERERLSLCFGIYQVYFQSSFLQIVTRHVFPRFQFVSI